MLHFSYVSVLCLLVLPGFSAEPNPKRDAIYYPLSARMDAVRSNANAAVEIAQIAIQAEQDYARESPDGVAMVYGTAAGIIGNSPQSDSSSLATYYEMLQRQRMYVKFVPLKDRFHMLYRTLPLNTEYGQLQVAPGAKPLRITELAFRLETWRELNGEIERVKDWKFELVFASIQPPRNPNDLEAQNRYQEEDAKNRAAGERNNYVSILRNKGSSFTNAVMQQIAREYGKSPHLLEQLQEVMDGYLPPADSTNVMNKVFEAMKPGVAAKTPRPVPGAKGERWIRAPEPRPEPGLPAIAKPSRIRDGIAPRGSQGVMGAVSPGAAVAGAEAAGSGGAAGGRAVWPWAVVGVGALGWAWLKMRGR